MKAVLLALGLALAAGSAHAQDPRVWTEGAGETDVSLTYAIVGVDDLGISFYCQRRSGQITISIPVKQRLAVKARGDTWLDSIGRTPPWPVSVKVTSTSSTTVRGLARPAPGNRGSTVSVELSDRAPVIGEFARTRRIQVQALGTTVEEPAPPARLASRFLRACR